MSRDWKMLVWDLDRCEHGRHEGDICSGVTGCNGPSHGNLLFPEGTVIGHTMEGDEIIVPPRSLRYGEAAFWVKPRGSAPAESPPRPEEDGDE